MGDRPPTESVRDYPRPPLPEPCGRRVRIELGGVLIADSTAALRVLETSHPANLYGGWVTASLRGPFKGGPGTTGW